ncbi:hypothetical protein ACKX2L_10800 [Lachnospiraceae bacterium YH-ros2228]
MHKKEVGKGTENDDRRDNPEEKKEYEAGRAFVLQPEDGPFEAN